MRTGPAALVALACLLALAGCGLGAGATPGGVRLTVTRDFGTRVLHETAHPKISGQDTIMSLLLRNFSVQSRFGGGFVESIDGASGGEARGQESDWFYYVNGVEAQKGAADTDAHRGDSIWWDLHDWTATQDVPAVVGSYPEPFLHGIAGKRLPVRVECARAAGAACQVVSSRLQQAGVPAATGALGAGGGPDLLRVLVGPWRELRLERQLQPLESGPRASGVYAKPNASGTELVLLDPDGRSGEHARRRHGARRRDRRSGTRADLGRHGHRRHRRLARRERARRRVTAEPLRGGGDRRRRAGAPGHEGGAVSALDAATRIAYRRRASPLHAAHAGVAAAYGGSLALAALLVEDPLVLVGLLAAVLLAAAAAGVGRQLLGAARGAALPMFAATVLVNVLVNRGGLTVFARLGDWGVLGQMNLTLESVVFGLVFGLRLLVVALACLLAVCTANPDELLLSMRRVSPRSALTASLTTRMVPVLGQDAQRLAEAQRCRADSGPGRAGDSRSCGPPSRVRLTARSTSQRCSRSAATERPGTHARAARSSTRAALPPAPATTSRSAPRRWRSR